MGTTKIQHPDPPPKEKEPGHPGCMLPHLIGCKNIFCLGVLFAHFWPRLVAMA